MVISFTSILISLQLFTFKFSTLEFRNGCDSKRIVFRFPSMLVCRFNLSNTYFFKPFVSFWLKMALNRLFNFEIVSIDGSQIMIIIITMIKCVSDTKVVKHNTRFSRQRKWEHTYNDYISLVKSKGEVSSFFLLSILTHMLLFKFL